MRVLFVNGRDDAGILPGGDTVQFEKTRIELENCGVEIFVRKPNELDHLPVCDLVHVFNIQTPQCTWSVFQAIQKKGIPIVLSPIYWDMYAYWFEAAHSDIRAWKTLSSLIGKKKARQVYISWQRKKSPRDPEWLVQKKLLQEANRVLPNSASEATHLRQTFLLDAQFSNKIDIVPNAIDTSLFDTPQLSGMKSNMDLGFNDFVLEVGTINPVKNQRGLIKAMFDSAYPIVLIGQIPSAFREYGEACKQLGARRGNVLFVEHLPHAELPAIYHSALVHALPSWRETPGLVSLEAAASGCKVVSTSIGSARDYFGDLATYCYPDDLDSIRSAVDRAVQSTASNELRQHVISHYTWEKAAQATLAAYHKALS